MSERLSAKHFAEFLKAIQERQRARHEANRYEGDYLLDFHEIGSTMEGYHADINAILKERKERGKKSNAG